MSKRTFIMDESFSFALVNFFEAPMPGWIVYDSNTEVSKELMNGYVVTTNAFIYKAVSYDMAHDVHPPLYSWILHTISSILKGRFTIWFSYMLNAPLFLINLLYSLNNVFCTVFNSLECIKCCPLLL